jgi:chromate transporter
MNELKSFSLKELTLYFLKLGSIGFGGPIALVGYMQRDLVDKRKWISIEDFQEGLALAQLAPGPLAAQLAIYIGWLKGRIWGATLIAFAFILPSLVMVLVLSEIYMQYGGLPWIQKIFYGVGASVIAIIALSAYKLIRRSLASDSLLWGIAFVSAVFTAWTESEIIWLFLIAGLIAMVAKTMKPTAKVSLMLLVPPWLIIGLRGPASDQTLLDIFIYFIKSGAFVFGSGLAIVPFLHNGVVNEFAWLTERQFLDAVGVAMITPGPVVITVAFIGYLVAGPLGGLIAAVGVFLPCYLFTVIPAPYFRQIAKNKKIKAFVDGVTAAAIGAIAGSAFVLGKRALLDSPSIIIAVATLCALLYFKKLPEPVLILLAGLAGMALK